jgi:hypothetical protein
MIGVVRWTALLLELGGIGFTVKLCHEGRLGAACLFLLFDTLMILVFVLCHVLVELVLDKYSLKSKGTWWL